MIFKTVLYLVLIYHLISTHLKPQGTVMLAIDEICDGGIIMEHDPCKVASRVTVRSEDLPLGEQTVSQVLQNYKEQLKMSLLR